MQGSPIIEKKKLVIKLDTFEEFLCIFLSFFTNLSKSNVMGGVTNMVIGWVNPFDKQQHECLKAA